MSSHLVPCPRCLAENREGAPSCERCGAPLAAPAPPPSRPARTGINLFSIRLGSVMAIVALIAAVLGAWRIHLALGVALAVPTAIALARTAMASSSRWNGPPTFPEHAATFARAFFSATLILAMILAVPASAVIALLGTCLAIASVGGPPAETTGLIVGGAAGIAAPILVLALLVRYVGRTRLRSGSPSRKRKGWIDPRLRR